MSVNFEMSFLPKDELKNFNFVPQPTGAEIFRSFFGRIENTKSPFEIN